MRVNLNEKCFVFAVRFGSTTSSRAMNLSAQIAWESHRRGRAGLMREKTDGVEGGGCAGGGESPTLKNASTGDQSQLYGTS